MVGALGVAYGLMFQFNIFIFSTLSYSESVEWIYLPSGLALIFVLLFGGLGAVAIALAAIPINYFQYFDNDVLSALGSGLISGFSPWLAKRICTEGLLLRLNLNQLTPQALIKVAVIFAALSSVLHQLFFTLQGHTENFAMSSLVMAFGNLMGTLIVLYVARWILKALPMLAKVKR
jgi:hypothetical protein